MNFFLKYKKIFLIIGFVLIVILLGYLLYVVFFKPVAPTPPTEPATTTTTPAGLPISPAGPGQVVEPGEPGALPDIPAPETVTQPSETARGGITQTNELIDAPALDATLSGDGTNIQYYNQDNGKFYKISPDGKVTELTDKIFYNVEDITWSPNKNKAILEYPDGSNIMYDFETKKQVTLPQHWEEFDYSPDSNQIVSKSLGLDPDNRYMIISNDNGSNIQPIEKLGYYEDTAYSSWSPNNQIVGMWTKGVDFNRQELLFLGKNNENYKSTIVEGRGLQFKWAPEGDRLLYSVYSSNNEYKPLLWIVNAQGNDIGTGRKNLRVETWAEKCTFSDNTYLYCGVPNSLEEGAGIFEEMAYNTTDSLYKINSKTGVKRMVAIPEKNHTIVNPIVSNDGKYLYFTDNNTNRLYKIDLE